MKNESKLSKGISSSIATILIATISITLVGTTYFFASSMLKQRTAQTFEVIDIFNNKVIVRNTGSETIREFKTLIDGKEVNNTFQPLEPQKIGSITLNLTGVPAGRHDLTLITKSMSQALRWNFKYVTTTTVPLEIAGVKVSLKEKQGEAEVGKPVKWEVLINLSNPSPELKEIDILSLLPKDAKNIRLKTIEGKAVRIKTLRKISLSALENTSLLIEYETPAPYKIEEEGSIYVKGKYVKTIKVISNASVHYENVKVSTYFPHKNFRLYHLLNLGFRNIHLLDVAQHPAYRPIYRNGRVEWIVPELSEQVFILQAAFKIKILQTYDIVDVPCNDPSPSCSCKEADPPVYCPTCTVDSQCIKASCSVTCPTLQNAVLESTNCSSTVASSSGCVDQCNPYPECGLATYCWGGGTCTATCNPPTGACYYNCNSGYGDCDGDYTNGCEADLNNDPDNCGACGNSCGQNANCTDGSCVCNPGWYNEDNDWSNGCENQAPYWYTPNVNNSNPEIRDVVSFNVNWTDTTGVNTSFGLGIDSTILSLNGTGENCNEWENVSIFEVPSSGFCTGNIDCSDYGEQSNCEACGCSYNEIKYECIALPDASPHCSDFTNELDCEACPACTWQTSESIWSNLTWQIPDQCAGKTIAWKQYANDTAGRWNVTPEYYITVPKGWLNVTLLEPNPIICNGTEPIQDKCLWCAFFIKWINATVECEEHRCGSINATARYNSTQGMIPINTSPDEPFYILDPGNNVQVSDGLDKGESVNVSWRVNVSTCGPAPWKINTFFNSSSLLQNETKNATIKIVPGANVYDVSFNAASFQYGDPLNCSGNVTDIKEMIQAVYYKIYYDDHESNPEYEGIIDIDTHCVGSNWTSGRICWAVEDSVEGLKGNWTCEIIAQCPCGNHSGYSDPILMNNTPPPESKITSPANNTWFNKYQDYAEIKCENISPDVNPEDTLRFTIEWSYDKLNWNTVCSNDPDGICDLYLANKSDGNIYLRCKAYDEEAYGNYSNITIIKIDRTDPTCILNITNITSSPYLLKGIYQDSGSGMSNVTYRYYNGTWNLIGTNSTQPYTWNWNVPSSLENKWINMSATCNDTAGNNITNQTYVAVDLINTIPKIWNLWIRDANDTKINESASGVAVNITVNASDPDPVWGIDYIEGNFTDVESDPSEYSSLSNCEGVNCYGNFSKAEEGHDYTHFWNYSIPYFAGPGQVWINVTVYDKNGTSNKTTTSNFTIFKTVEIILKNKPINFPLTKPGEEVNASFGYGWPLVVYSKSNVLVNISQNGTDLAGTEETSWYIDVTHILWNIYESSPFNSLLHSFQKVIDNLQPGKNQSIYYKFQTPTVRPQEYIGNVTIRGEG